MKAEVQARLRQVLNPASVVDDETKRVLDELKRKAGRKWRRLALGRGLKGDNEETSKQELSAGGSHEHSARPVVY